MLMPTHHQCRPAVTKSFSIVLAEIYDFEYFMPYTCQQHNGVLGQKRQMGYVTGITHLLAPLVYCIQHLGVGNSGMGRV